MCIEADLGIFMQDRQHWVNYDFSVELQIFLLTSLPLIYSKTG